MARLLNSSLKNVNSVNMLSSNFCDGVDHIFSDVDEDLKEGVVVFDVAAEHVDNLSIILNSRTTTDFKDFKSIHDVIDITRFSSLKKLIMVTGYVIRFVNNLKGTLKNATTIVISDDTLTIDEYKTW